MTDLRNKKHSTEITGRFLVAMDRIIANREDGKVTAKSFGEVIGISSSNLTRLRNSSGENIVTVEALGRICNYYNVSPLWLMTGVGDIFQEKGAVNSIEDRLSKLEVAIKKIKRN